MAPMLQPLPVAGGFFVPGAVPVNNNSQHDVSWLNVKV